MGRLTDKVAIVTGGGGGIGGATARALAREGAAVLVVDINQAAAELVANGITESGGQRRRRSRPTCPTSLRSSPRSRPPTSNFGRLDILHNNAALTDSDFLTRDTAVTDLSLDVWQRTLEVNLQSQMLTCKHAVPEMVRGGGGSIINMSSGASLKGDRTRTAYGVSKAGVNALSMYVATSHGKQGIRVNTILPGLIITDAVRAHLDEKMVANLGKAVLTPLSGPARGHRGRRRVPGLGRVPLHHGADDRRRRRDGGPRRARGRLNEGGRARYDDGPRTYSPVSAWWYQPLAAWVPPSTWMVWPVT